MEDPNAPVELTRVSHEMLAAPVVAALEEAGIETRVVGGFTAGFVAEAPGTAQIMVKTKDLEAAQIVLDRYNAAEEQTDDEQD